MAEATTSIKKIRRRSTDFWPILISQTNLLLIEIGILLLLTSRLLIGSILIILGHLFAWRRTIWRRQDITALIRILGEAAALPHPPPKKDN